MAHKLASAPVSESPQKPIKKIGETDRPLTIGAFLRDTVMGAGMGMLIGGVFSLAFSMGYIALCAMPCSHRLPSQRAGSRSTLHGWLYIQQYGLQSI